MAQKKSKSHSKTQRKKKLHIDNTENIETEASKDGFDLGEESSNKTEAKDKFGTFEGETIEEKPQKKVEKKKEAPKKEKDVPKKEKEAPKKDKNQKPKEVKGEKKEK